MIRSAVSASANASAARPIARGAQLPLLCEPLPAPASADPPRRLSSPRRTVCPRCAGPTASHGRRRVCVICGFGARPARLTRQARRSAGRPSRPAA